MALFRVYGFVASVQGQDRAIEIGPPQPTRPRSRRESEQTWIIMSTLQQRIASKFLQKLAESKQVDARKIQRLRKLLTASKRPKADDFVKVFSLPAGGDLQ